MGWRRHSPFMMSVLLVFTLSACRQEAVAPALPVDTDAPITTDHERYTPEAFGDRVTYTIEVSYTNTTDESVYLTPCGYEPPSYYLERFNGETWQRSNFGYPCPAVLAPSVEVKTGENLTATLQLDAYRSPDAFPQFGTDLVPGVHRLVFAITASVDNEGFANDDPLPLE
jgi:hypothetical protein